MRFSVITSAFNQLPIIKEARPHWDKQSFKDFEWVIADDGSTDGIDKWAKTNDLSYVYQVNKGYRLSKILNKAVEQARGDYLVFVMGDSYPKFDFLEQLDRVAEPNRVINGVRINVDKEGKIVSPDWRLGSLPMEDGADLIDVDRKHPWGYMTLNSLCIPKKLYKDVGGMCEEYETYGREDWDLIMRAYFAGYPLFWAVKAIIYHRDHPEKPENPANIMLFESRVLKYEKKAKNSGRQEV